MLRTIAEIYDNSEQAGLQPSIIVVDNASTDGTADAIHCAFPDVHVIARDVNDGCAGRNVGVAAARSRYIMFLDDDSWPIDDTASRCVAYLDAHPNVAAVGGRVDLPDGAQDGAALPIVLPACAMCVRVDAFISVGGFDGAFMRQAEEYDLIFKLIGAGWAVARFQDVRWRHEKVAQSRNSTMIRHLDLRNNLVLVSRYLPAGLRAIYRRDWLQRYIALAHQDDNASTVAAAVGGARAMIWSDRSSPSAHRAVPLGEAAMERIFDFDGQTRDVAQWSEAHGIKDVVIADLSKNIYATLRACRLAGLRIRAVIDDTPAFRGLAYRGIPVLPTTDAPQCDGIVLSTINPATVEQRVAEMRSHWDGPLLSLWRGRTMDAPVDATCASIST